MVFSTSPLAENYSANPLKNFEGKELLAHRDKFCSPACILHSLETAGWGQDQGWANIEKLSRTNIWKYLKKWNMLERIFEYSMIFILNIQIFEYLCIEVLTSKSWDLTRDTGNLTFVTQECEHCLKIAALMVWEFKDSNQKDDRLNQSISNGSVCKTVRGTPNKGLLYSQRVQC